jgi:hypothetical protein
MADEIKYGMHCAEFEALLFDAIDGTLGAGPLAQFKAHATACTTCGPLFAEADAGQRWMKSLAEVEPPKNLVHNILAKTSGKEVRLLEQAGTKTTRSSWWQPVLAGVWATVRQPRFGMSVAMAFFSVSLVMSVAGIKVHDLAKVDLRPSAITRTYYSTQARVVKYYTNMRFYYEMESQVRDLKKAIAPVEGGATSKPKDKNQKKDNTTSGTPKKGQETNYARDEMQPLLADAGVGRTNGVSAVEQGMKQLGMGDVDGNSILLTDTTSIEKTIDEARRVA